MISELIVLLLLALPVPDPYGCNTTPTRTTPAIDSINMVGHHEQPPYSYGWQAKPFVDVCWCWSPLWAASFTPVTGFLDNLLVVVLVMVGHDRNHADECCRSHCTEVENYAAGLLYRHWYFFILGYGCHIHGAIPVRHTSSCWSSTN